MYRFGVEIYPGYRVDESAARVTRPVRKAVSSSKTTHERSKTGLPSQPELAPWILLARSSFTDQNEG